MNCKVLKKGKCEITNGYGTNHYALDLVGENYTLDDVVAHSAGTIIELSDGFDNNKGSIGLASYGNYIKISHNNGYATLYAHLGKNLPHKKGDYVEAGAYLGQMSNSGNAYGAHLHFEVIKNGTRINPTLYLNTSFSSSTPHPTNLKYQIGDHVKINGVYISSTSIEKLTPAITEGTITKILPGTNNPYLLEDGRIGWINDNVIINDNNIPKYLSNTTYTGFSIVDALKQINIDSSYAYRSNLAKLNDIPNYTGTGIENIRLLNLLKEGKLKY